MGCDTDQAAHSGQNDSLLPERILRTANNYDSSKQSVAAHTAPRPVLGFVTPWNKGGYTVAKRFKGKITHVAPVWFQIQRQGPEKYQISGQSLIDTVVFAILALMAGLPL